MQMHIFVGDVHLERVPQYSVTMMKLQVWHEDEEIDLFGKWSSDSQKIRFQDTIHTSTASLATDSIQLSFTLLAVLDGAKANSRLIGSGICLISVAKIGVPQTVMLRSSNMASLMAQLLIIVSYDQSGLVKCADGGDNSHVESAFVQQRHSENSHDIISKAAKEISTFGYETAPSSAAMNRSRSSSRSRARHELATSADCGPLSNPVEDGLSHSRSNVKIKVVNDSGISGVTAVKAKKVPGFREQRQPPQLKRPESGGEMKHGRLNSSPFFQKQDNRLETLKQFTDRAKLKAEVKKNIDRSTGMADAPQNIHIYPEAMKENEACERLRGALDRKDIMLQRAKSQLDISVRGSIDAKEDESNRSVARQQNDQSTERFERFTLYNNKDNHQEGRLEDRLKQAESRRLLVLKETADRAAHRSQGATNRSIAIKAAAIKSHRACNKLRNALDLREEVLKIVETQLGAISRSSISAMHCMSNNNSSGIELLQVARNSLEEKEFKKDERRALDINDRLQLAEDRRLRVLRDQKNRASAMVCEATCKADAIREAAQKASRAYDKLRNDFDRKDEMLRKIQSDLDTSTRSARGRNHILVHRNSCRSNGSAEGSPLMPSREKAGDGFSVMRSTSAPARGRGASLGLPLPFSELGRVPRYSNPRGYSTVEEQVARNNGQRRFADSYDAGAPHHVHCIPSVPLMRSAPTHSDYSMNSENDRTHHSSDHPYPASPPLFRPATRSHATDHSGTAFTTDIEDSRAAFRTSTYGSSRSKARNEGGRAAYSPSPRASPVKLPVADMHVSHTKVKLMHLMQHRIEGLKQKIAEVSPAEGEVILRMIRKVLPLTAALSLSKRTDKRAGASRGQDHSHRESTTPSGGRKVPTRSNRKKRILRGIADAMVLSKSPSGGVGQDLTYGAISNRNTCDESEDAHEDSDDDDDDVSIHADLLVAQLWDILGVTAEYGSPRKALGSRELSSARKAAELRTEDGAGSRYLGKAEPVRSSYRAASEEAPPLCLERDSDLRGYDHSALGYPESKGVDDTRQAVNNFCFEFSTPSTDDYLARSTSLGGKGERWWSNDYLALEAEIKHIIDSCSPVKFGQIGAADDYLLKAAMVPAASFPNKEQTDKDDILRTTQPVFHSYRDAALSPTSLVIEQLTREGAESSGRLSRLYSDVNDASVDILSHHAYSVAPEIPAYRAAFTSPLPQAPTSSSRAPWLIGESPEHVRGGTSLQLESQGRAVPKDAYDDVDDSTVNDSYLANTNDTSACISRQIDDVGRAISTLQTRIASYMYISPDVSPGVAILGRVKAISLERDLIGTKRSPADDTAHGGDRGEVIPVSVEHPMVTRTTPDIANRDAHAAVYMSDSSDDTVHSDEQSSETCSIIDSESTSNTCSDFSMEALYSHKRRSVEIGKLNGAQHNPASYGQFSSSVGPEEPLRIPGSHQAYNYFDSSTNYGTSKSLNHDQTASSKNYPTVPSFGNTARSKVVHSETGGNNVDVSLSVRDMDMGNLSYDTMSFAAERMMLISSDVQYTDLGSTDDLLEDIFDGDDEIEQEKQKTEGISYLKGPYASQPQLDLKLDFESDSEDLEAIFGPT